jgi:hypothetical protein
MRRHYDCFSPLILDMSIPQSRCVAINSRTELQTCMNPRPNIGKVRGVARWFRESIDACDCEVH